MVYQQYCQKEYPKILKIKNVLKVCYRCIEKYIHGILMFC